MATAFKDYPDTGHEGAAATKAMSPDDRKRAEEAVRRGLAAAGEKAAAILDNALRQAATVYEGPDDCPAAVRAAWGCAGEALDALARGAKALAGKK